MSKRTIPSTRIPDRLSYLWLALAAVLYLFAGIQWVIPLAAWLAPLFLLRFVRTQHPLPGLLLAWLVRAAIAEVVFQGIILYPSIIYYPLVVLLTGLTLLPYLADRLITPRLGGFVATLVFPLAYTMIEYLGSFGPFGTITSIANTQYGNLPLMQLVSVTGIWGITFLITWFASVVNWAWEQHFAWPRIRAGVLLYAGLLGLVLFGGGLRLALLAPQGQSVRVAGISVSRTVETAAMKQIATAFPAILAGRATQADLEALRQGADML